jgi:hypothetical protein
VSENRAPEPPADDAFEAREMHDGSPVVHRDKRVSRAMAGIMTLPALVTMAIALVIATQNATASKPLPPEALPFVVGGMALMSLLFLVGAVALGVLRSVVTTRALHVKYGLWGPTIDLEKIRAARVISYPLFKYGGWGIRRALDGSWAYVTPNPGDVVEIEYDDEHGTSKKVVIGAENATALVAAIQRARQKTRLRIEAFEAPTSTRDSGDAELEALAEEEVVAQPPPFGPRVVSVLGQNEEASCGRAGSARRKSSAS